MNTKEHIIDKYKLDIGKGYIVEIPNMGRDNMAELFAELGFTKGVEVGVYKGEYSEVLCRVNPDLKLWGVDPYDLYCYEPGLFNEDVTPETFQKFRLQAEKVLAPYRDRYTFVYKPSMEATKDFPDESIDFVYIDANHDLPNVINDIHYWTKKVKKGGIVSGHDYARYPSDKFNHVKRGLEAYAWSYRTLPLFIVGREEVLPGEVRDKFRSWFFVKE